MKKIFIIILTASALIAFFSFRLTTVPAGITGDEGAFGYNAILLSRSLHDENGRRLPAFVLSLGGTDWRQPVTQYFAAFLFKLFGPSLFNLRLTAVLTTAISILLIYFLAKKLTDSVLGGASAAVFLGTAPIIMIQSHLGLDNIAPVPFIIGWMTAIYLWGKSKRNFWLVIAGICLGIGFYSYKGMRIFVPVWAIITVIYLMKDFWAKRNGKIFLSILKPVLIFSLSLLPFFAIIPYLEFKYAGAVLSGQQPVFEGFYKLFYPYLAAFDPSFLFIKGDDLLFHSTGTHGMYLLMSLPFFIIGLAVSWKKEGFWKFVIASFFLGPLLFGLFGSIHRASRMLAEVPIFALISGVGLMSLWKQKTKILLITLSVLFLINYFDFIHYYLWQYASDTQSIFNCFICSDSAYKTLKNESVKLGLIPYVDGVVASHENEVQYFARAIYFVTPPKIWDGKSADLPKNAVLMTDNSNVNFLKKIGQSQNLFYYIWK